MMKLSSYASQLLLADLIYAGWGSTLFSLIATQVPVQPA